MTEKVLKTALNPNQSIDNVSLKALFEILARKFSESTIEHLQEQQLLR